MAAHDALRFFTDPGRRRQQAVSRTPSYGEPVKNSQSEEDVAGDPQLAESRETGGEPGDQDGADGVSTTGTAENQEFVGRVAGDDVGYAGETGAERRAAAGE